MFIWDSNTLNIINQNGIRAFYNNLYALGVLENLKTALQSKGVDYNSLEDIEDDALGNGGLGRLAACLLDSAATHNLPVNGYGIRYKYGLFKQKFENGFQVETEDNWQQYGDPWSVRREEEKVTVKFGDSTVYAVPYDMPIIGYGAKTINTLRLWQSEPIEDFNFTAFNDQRYDLAVEEKNKADNICMVIYPNDDADEGKILRLKQQSKVYAVIVKMNKQLTSELKRKGLSPEEVSSFQIIDNGLIHMARMAIYATFSTNGVAKIHTDILKNDALKNWYSFYPSRFQNKTNGITQRRWLCVCNPQLNRYLHSLGISGFEKNLEKIQSLLSFAENKEVFSNLNQIKRSNKQVLSDYILKKEGVWINPDFIFDIQVKRLHEYKRQLMNAFSILTIYYGIKDG